MTQEIGTMSARELERLAIIERVECAGLGQAQAAAQMGVSERHARRLLQRRRRALALLRERYPDFGPTLAHEKLHQPHRGELGADFSVETLRQWMIAAGLWQGRCRAPARVHQSRPRRCALRRVGADRRQGADWFEGRRDPCTLIAFIDDATSQVTELRFFEAETTFAYLQCLHHPLRR